MLANTGLYKFLLLLHLFTVVVGFGGVFLNGVYGRLSEQRRGPEGLAIAEANDFVSSRVAEYFIYAVFVTGILLVLASEDAVEFGQTWIWLSIVLYVVALGISHGVLMPSNRRMLAALRAGQPPGIDARRVAAAGAFLNVVLVVLLALMVWKPGL